jgi:hypothetical protein
MGLIREQEPLLGKRGPRVVSASHEESRQQVRRSTSRLGLTRSCDRVLSGGISLVGTFTGCVHDLGRCISTSLHPFAPPELPGFFATMGALTPARRLFVSLSGTMNSARYRAGLPVSCHRTFRSFRLQPPTVAPTYFWGFLRRAYRTTFPWPPFWGRASIGLRHWLAGSPRQSAESSSLALRTNRSPPVALHPASRRRSYRQLRSARTPRQGLAPC